MTRVNMVELTENNRQIRTFVCCFCCAFRSHLPGLSSMMLIWTAGVTPPQQDAMAEAWTADFLVLGQAVYHWATLFVIWKVCYICYPFEHTNNQFTHVTWLYQYLIYSQCKCLQYHQMLSIVSERNQILECFKAQPLNCSLL